MLTQKEKKHSKYKDIYEIVVPKTHLLRKIQENVDFSFANKIMEDCYCKNFGRPAYEPEIMLKILFLKLLHDLSDREVMCYRRLIMSKNSRVQMSRNSRK